MPPQWGETGSSHGESAGWQLRGLARFRVPGMAEEGHVDAASIRELHEMEEQLHRLYASTCSVAARQEAVHALALVRLIVLGERLSV